ncbi:SAM hydrolase/SAM-dependent halogenase family protein [Lutimonas sp.]|uniref:SAM hydrolase/SAM-dependent halogenase family protein n=1 Tax=Lutimonas sp. TaxID=1872403 RepID=UPI003D9AD7FD
MPIITLTTDFGTKDHFVGAVKGSIYSELKEVRIVDISHEITPFSVTETAYILKNAYKNFPPGTIHIVGVDSEISVENRPIAIEMDEQFFICGDNGILSMITNEINPDKIVEITIQEPEDDKLTILGMFIKVACHIARGGTLEVIGKRIETIKKIYEIQPQVNTEKNQLVGSIIYIDNFGNAISNISKAAFHNIGKGRSFEIIARNYKFVKIYDKYNDIVDFDIPLEKRQDDGKKLAIFNCANYLEISIYRSNLKTVGGASNLLGLDYRDNITIRFI